ncbi:MAG: isoprenyl transferase [Lachnospiraceae bacterium]|nr:isoprenyl transferase [Lachnospiraceae bacterium]
MEESNRVPNHIAIILDGNGRWAKKRGLPRNMGHAEGAKAVEQCVYNCADLGVKYLTVYGFSTENWKRPDEEVNALMKIFRVYIKKLMGVAKKKNVRVLMIGERSRFAPDIQEAIEEIEEVTKNNTTMTFIFAINYGGRDEITRAVRKIAAKVKGGELETGDITEDTISSNLDTAGVPDPDLMIRTSGEQRLSNWLIWQLAYAEFYFTDILWPDFGMEELKKAIEYYNGRDRRFGAVK